MSTYIMPIAREVCPNDASLAEFLSAYIESALWTEEDELDCHNPAEFAPETVSQILADCTAFYGAFRAEIDAATVGRPTYHSNAATAGHDFWLTRNHHGSGFWDGDWEEVLGEKLTAAAHGMKTAELYRGDDGKIYHI